MVFNSKQLEELESIHDSTGAFEEEADDDGFSDEVGEAAMDWRRSLIEEAAENIKRAKTRPVEPQIQYPIHQLLFDREARRFARVQRSVPGFLKIVYLAGGDREYGTLDVVGYLKEHGAKHRLSELSEQLGMIDVDVAIELDRLGIIPVEELPQPEPSPQAAERALAVPPVVKSARVVPPGVGAVDEAADDSYDDSDEDIDDGEEPQEMVSDEPSGKGSAKGHAKMSGKAVPQAKGSPAKGEKNAKAKPATPEKALPKGKPAAAQLPSKGPNPLDEPNAYIKANFQEKSNKLLARETGLSEHTIRRKLGEWGLRRTK